MQSKATVIIYMGMKKLEEISTAYIENNCGNMPAAIIQHASLPYKKMAKGVAKDLLTMASDHQLTHPSIIVIGNVADVSKLL